MSDVIFCIDNPIELNHQQLSTVDTLWNYIHKTLICSHSLMLSETSSLYERRKVKESSPQAIASKIMAPKISSLPHASNSKPSVLDQS